MISKTRSIGLGVFALVLVVGLGGQATAGQLWYNGDFDGTNGLANEVNTQVAQSNIYDDFNVTAAGGSTVTSVFSNNLMSVTGITQAEWEIRSGVSLGDGGTLIASGTSAATQTATGRSGFGLTEYTIAVSGLSVSLAQGTYWLTVAPVDSGNGRSFISTTSGANAIGTPPGNDGNSFWNSSSFNENFGSPSDALGPGPANGGWDFSMGVDVGTASVPEPSTFVMLGCSGLIGLGYWWRKRRATATA